MALSFRNIVGIVCALLAGSLSCRGFQLTPVRMATGGPDQQKPHQPFVENLRTTAAAGALALAVGVGIFQAPPGAAADSVPAGTNPFSSICMGFGCGAYQGLDYNGAEAPTDEASLPFKDFLGALDNGAVERVEFFGANGDKAYAYIKEKGASGDAKRIRVGEGYPEEQSKAWSSPLWVVRALNDRHVPYKFMYDLGSVQNKLTVNK